MGADPGCELCVSSGPDEWVLSYSDADPASERTRETLLTVGNGYFATRGAAPEATADESHYPGTYAAGLYNRLTSQVDGQTREDESIVNLPNWLPLTFRSLGGEWLVPEAFERVHEHLVLDMRRGLLTRELLVADRNGRRTRLRQRRLVSMAAPHLGALETRIVLENWSGRIEIRSALDGRVSNGNVSSFGALAAQHLTVTETGCDGRDLVWLVAETSSSKQRVAEVARTLVYQGGHEVRADRRTVSEAGLIGQELEIDVGQGEDVVIDKAVALFTSRDRAIAEPLVAAREEITDASKFEDLLLAHSAAWDRLWQRFHVGLDDGDGSRLPVHVHVFHLLQALSPHTADLDAGVPAPGLHGESYRGHIFWDELFVFPFLNFRLPELTRALLRYRHRRLPQARRRAAALGMKGALFPWESGSDGREETPRASWNPHAGRWRQDYSSRQYHVNLAVAYNVWHYWQTTADFGFLAAYGAELLFETGRFAASLATYDPNDDRYDIRGVMGPDEFHDGYPDRPGQGIDNSAYVNIMTAWTLARARDAHELIGKHHGDEMWQGLRLSDAELQKWDHISRRLRVCFLPNGLIEQFEGYGRLAERDWDEFKRQHGDLKTLGLVLEAENDSPNRYQASKQADVLMLLYLFTAEELTALVRQLNYPFDPAIIPQMIDYYMRRTSHGSSLSRVAHAWVLSRTDRSRSWEMLRAALNSDIADREGGSTSEGIHLGAMAGSLDILQRGYTGLDTREDMLWLNPMLPDELRSLDLDIRYRGQWINLRVDPTKLTLHAHPGGAAPPSKVTIRERVYDLAPGATIEVPRNG
ncbi:Trehalose and maltose hydrolase (possible phosphorylase) [Micromonospora pattaloongensis]|uniref:Trehalose and maltose hydrolase (Possible phosphorylase) n=1 Tax=Micromonospora pattaloongensis TaxID=405436 RepID=A0A1H3NL84_9ACTN|nr:glycosyl hydrolase family 65 protein [Micromonospora pattaloongensis]SDY89686.1 Trehalose and maltose hydrolase (possible phosphorylase) [Micromonospora pattaloongensis]